MCAMQVNETDIPYPDVPASPSFPKIEEEVLAFWKQERIFERSVEQRPLKDDAGGSNEFVFYDGPPFANGLPHYGHLVTGFVKDIVPRYRTMQGKRVERRFGWDCHGLPAELTSEKELGISGRHQILELGIDKFNKHCETSVLRFTQEWEDYVTRQGRWVDFKNDYKTMDITFMESVLWAFKQLYDKGLVYEGYRVVPYSWAVQTPLSNSRRASTTPIASVRTRASRSASFWMVKRRRHDFSPGRPHRGPCPPTLHSPSVPTLSTRSSRRTESV